MLPDGLLADAQSAVAPGTGHMGPIAHAEAIVAEIALHIRQAEEPSQAKAQTGSTIRHCLELLLVAI
jgi:hypothetical protein